MSAVFVCVRMCECVRVPVCLSVRMRACLSDCVFAISSPKSCPPLSPIPLSETSILLSLLFSFKLPRSALAPMSPMLLPRKDSSRIRPLDSRASASAAQPRPAKLL